MNGNKRGNREAIITHNHMGTLNKFHTNKHTCTRTHLDIDRNAGMHTCTRKRIHTNTHKYIYMQKYMKTRVNTYANSNLIGYEKDTALRELLAA